MKTNKEIDYDRNLLLYGKSRELETLKLPKRFKSYEYNFLGFECARTLLIEEEGLKQYSFSEFGKQRDHINIPKQKLANLQIKPGKTMKPDEDLLLVLENGEEYLIRLYDGQRRKAVNAVKKLIRTKKSKQNLQNNNLAVPPLSKTIPKLEIFYHAFL